MRFTDTAETFGGYLTELKALNRTRRERADEQNKLLDGRAFTLAADPERRTLAPERAPAVTLLDWAALDAAVVRVKASADRFDHVQAAGVAPERRAAVNAILAGMEQRLLHAQGLPGRPWFQNLAYAPGVLTGYGSKTFPGVREAIESDRYEEAQVYITATAAALNRYADGLEAASTAAGG